MQIKCVGSSGHMQHCGEAEIKEFGRISAPIITEPDKSMERTMKLTDIALDQPHVQRKLSI